MKSPGEKKKNLTWRIWDEFSFFFIPLFFFRLIMLFCISFVDSPGQNVTSCMYCTNMYDNDNNNILLLLFIRKKFLDCFCCCAFVSLIDLSIYLIWRDETKKERKHENEMASQ